MKKEKLATGRIVEKLEVAQMSTYAYFIKLEINFGEYGETSSHVFRSSLYDEWEAAKEFASQYYQETEEENGKYSVNGDFYYSIGAIKQISEKEYDVLAKFL